MTYLFVADVHIGNHRRFGGPTECGMNRRCHEVLETLRFAADRAHALGAHLVILGDLFDTIHPVPQMVAAVQNILEGVPCTVLLGNHEQVSTAEGDHALGPLAPVARVVSMPSMALGDDGTDLVLIPYRPGDAVSWFEDAVKTALGPVLCDPPHPRILGMHLGIKDHATPPFLQGAYDAVPLELLVTVCQKYGIKHVFSGNWHEHRSWLTNTLWAVQVGALCPTGWNNPGLDNFGYYGVWGKTVGGASVHRVPGPRFVTVDSLDELPEDARLVYALVRARPEEVSAVVGEIDTLVSKGLLRAGEVIPDRTEEKAAVKAAATKARSATTLDVALDGYVREMPLEDGIDRERILARVKGYLK